MITIPDGCPVARDGRRRRLSIGEIDSIAAKCSAAKCSAAKCSAARCQDASPATHPPCNVVNPCVMMREEIARSCGLFEGASPLPAELCAAGRSRDGEPLRGRPEPSSARAALPGS